MSTHYRPLDPATNSTFRPQTWILIFYLDINGYIKLWRISCNCLYNKRETCMSSWSRADAKTSSDVVRNWTRSPHSTTPNCPELFGLLPSVVYMSGPQMRQCLQKAGCYSDKHSCAINSLMYSVAKLHGIDLSLPLKDHPSYKSIPSKYHIFTADKYLSSFGVQGREGLWMNQVIGWLC